MNSWTFQTIKLALVLGCSTYAAGSCLAASKKEAAAFVQQDLRCIGHEAILTMMARRSNDRKLLKQSSDLNVELNAMLIYDGDEAGIPDQVRKARKAQYLSSYMVRWNAMAGPARKAQYIADDAFCHGQAFSEHYADVMVEIEEMTKR